MNRSDGMHSTGSTRSGLSSRSGAPRSVHESLRAKKQAEDESRAIENRIRYFKREEEKIWKDLDDVRRQASKIESGRGRTIEKRLADQHLHEAKIKEIQEKKLRAQQQREHREQHKHKNADEVRRAKQLAGEQRKREQLQSMQQKRIEEAQERLRNSERAVAIQRSQLEAKLKTSKDQAERLAALRAEHEDAKQRAHEEVVDATSRLPELEREEQLWLQRLQNSRIVTQSVLEELEVSLGAAPPMMRSKGRLDPPPESASPPREE